MPLYSILRCRLITVLAGLLALAATPTVFAWGERGHDLVTRVAAQHLRVLGADNPALTLPFIKRDHMLSHLSNAPDFYWRAAHMPQAVRDSNYTTHYVNLERAYETPDSLDDLDLEYSAFTAKARARGHVKPQLIGSAPWRILQLHKLMVTHLRAAGDASDAEAKVTAINQALQVAGLMSHFSGDLANPHHTSMNHDGQLTGNTGLHAYFESDIVSELPMILPDQVMQATGTPLSERSILLRYDAARREAIENDAQLLVFALVIDSFANLSRLEDLDNQHSIIERSKDDTTPALRKPPREVMDNYAEFAIERLSLGAAVTAQLWYLAWQQAGQPDMSDYHSYHYITEPDFIWPDYLEGE